MGRWPRTMVAMCAMVLVGSCASPPLGEPFSPEVVDPARAVVYVFRDAAGGLRTRPVQVFINQESVGTLLPGQYLSRSVPAAEAIIRVEGDASSARPVRLQPGDAAYVQVRTPAFGPTKPTLEILGSEPARRILSSTTRVPP